MTPEAKQWRDHFAACEAEQLRDFPLHEPQTLLERAQYQLALDFFRAELPLEKMHRIEDQCKRRPEYEKYETAIAFCADEPTRCAFFDHFGFDHEISIFCLLSQTWNIVLEAYEWRNKETVSFSTNHHTFKLCVKMNELELEWVFRKSIPAETERQSLFVRDFSSSFASASQQVWQWDSTTFVHRPEYDSSWIS